MSPQPSDVASDGSLESPRRRTATMPHNPKNTHANTNADGDEDLTDSLLAS